MFAVEAAKTGPWGWALSARRGEAACSEGLTAPDHTSPREAIVWVESGEAGSTRRFLPPPARDAAPHQSSISAPRYYRVSDGRKIQDWGGEHRKAIILLKAIEGKIK